MICLKLNETLKYFKAVINTASDRMWHYERPHNEKFPWGVWSEYSEEDSLHANNRKQIQPVMVILDYYTKEEFDPAIDKIQSAMNDAPGIAFDLSDIQYDEETKSIHYTWNVEVAYGEYCERGIRPA